MDFGIHDLLYMGDARDRSAVLNGQQKNTTNGEGEPYRLLRLAERFEEYLYFFKEIFKRLFHYLFIDPASALKSKVILRAASAFKE